MNIKFFASATAAMLIGFAVMMLPLVLETETEPSSGQPWIPFGITEGENGERYLDNTDVYASQPYSITSSSLILLTGLVIASTAYILFKRQLHQQPTTFSS